MTFKGWRAQLVFWLHVAGSVAWLAAGCEVVYICFKYVKWSGAQ